MARLLCISSQPLTKLALALMCIGYCVGRSQQLRPTPNSCLGDSDCREESGTTAIRINLESCRKPALRALLHGNRALVVNSLLDRRCQTLLPNKQRARPILAL